MLQGLRTVVFRVSDLERAKNWYADLVGKAPYFDQPFYVGFDVGGYELGLTPNEDGETHAGGDTAYWGVEDVQAAMARATEHGATTREAPHDVGEGIVVGSVTDPFGNVLGFIKNLHFAPPLVHAAASDVSDRVIVVEARVPTSPERAFALWTTSEGMAAWWSEHNRIELRPGGFYELYFMLDEPPGRRGGEGNRVLSYLPNRMLSFSWNAPPNLKTRPLRTWVVLEFERAGEGSQLRLSHLGWSASEWSAAGSEWPETYAYFEEAWARVMQRFAASFQS